MKFLACVSLFVLVIAQAASIGNGQIYILNLPEEKAKNLSQDGKKLRWIDNPNQKGYKFAIISAKYAQKNKITIQNGDEKIVLDIAKQPYKKEQISVAKSKVNPPKSVLERIRRESDEADKVYATLSPEFFITKPFSVPLKSKITSPYGGIRTFNGTLKRFHDGTDFRAAVGVKIPASNDGIVRIAKDRYYAGGSVVIDHGSGIYTQYYHLSKILVKNGDKVKRGEIVGLSGASGRVSGPHLHFGIFANGMQVDPMQFISHFNQKIFNSK